MGKISGFIGSFIGGVLALAWPYGVWIAFSEHAVANGVMSILIPPYAWYLSAESILDIKHKPKNSENRDMTITGDDKSVTEFLISKCQNNEEEQRRSGLEENRYNLFCACYWTKLVSIYPDGEAEYFDQYGKNSPEFDVLAKTLAFECAEVAQN